MIRQNMMPSGWDSGGFHIDLRPYWEFRPSALWIVAFITGCFLFFSGVAGYHAWRDRVAQAKLMTKTAEDFGNDPSNCARCRLIAARSTLAAPPDTAPCPMCPVGRRDMGAGLRAMRLSTAAAR